MLSRRKVLWIAFAAFFLSGAAGLIYEVAWSRMLGLVFGNTSHAVATVISVYMLGLGAGAFLIGRVADRFKNALLLYAILELAVGAYCFFTPTLFKGIEVAYIGAYRHLGDSPAVFTLVRFLLCFVVLLFPTLLMGGTLPALSKFFVEHTRQFGVRVGLLYGINTLGAVAGCAGAGFVLLPALGVSHSIYLAVAINCALGFGITIVALRLPGEAQREAAVERSLEPRAVLPTYQVWLLLVAFSLSAFASLAYEVAWTRVFCLAMGSSVYAFSAILSAFLFGIGVGSLMYSWLWRPSWSEDPRWFGGMQLGMAFSVILLLLPFGVLPIGFGRILDQFQGNFPLVVIGELGMTILLVFIPTAIMGISFPLVTGLVGPTLRRVGRGVGTIYGINTLGSVLGSLAAGFLLIPTIGIQTTIEVAALVNAAVGALVIVSHPRAIVKNSLATGTAVLAVILAVGLIPSWHRTVLTSGPFWAYPGASSGAAAASEAQGRTLIYYRDGLNATVSVFEQREGRNPSVLTNRWISINGKPEASLMKIDMYNQLFEAHAPLLLARHAKKVLVIGLGSGITLGAISTYPEVEALHCAEMEQAMVEGARFFREENRAVLENPKTKLIVNDGRNYLLATEETYDVIVSEPSNPWMAGVANLFTREFLALCKARLNQDGLMCLWFHTYRMSLLDMKMVVRTFSEAFPNSSMWFAMPSDIFLMGWKDPLQKPSLSLLRQRLAGNPEAVKDLASLRILYPSALTACFLMDSQAMKRFCAGAPLHTDDHPILEFSAPRSMFANTMASNFRELQQARAEECWPFPDLAPDVARHSEFHYYNALALEYKELYQQATKAAMTARKLSPDSENVLDLLARLQERTHRSTPPRGGSD